MVLYVQAKRYGVSNMGGNEKPLIRGQGFFYSLFWRGRA
jgi:hypothetical protein